MKSFALRGAECTPCRPPNLAWDRTRSSQQLRQQPYFLAGIVILETVMVSPFISPVNVTPA
jgi:hypothetical protein